MRKIVQIALNPLTSGEIYGLCDDGSLWRMRQVRTSTVAEWARLPDIPQDAEEPEASGIAAPAKATNEFWRLWMTEPPTLADYPLVWRRPGDSERFAKGPPNPAWNAYGAYWRRANVWDSLNGFEKLAEEATLRGDAYFRINANGEIERIDRAEMRRVANLDDYPEGEAP